MSSLIHTDLFAYVVIPLLIFLARIIDVSIGTIRVILLTRGQKFISPLLGFIEMLIWLTAIGQLIKHLDNWACYLAFAAGFGMGNFVGLLIEEKLALGTVVLRIITHRDATELIDHFKKTPFGITHVEAHGKTGKVSIIFTVLKRSDLPTAIEIVDRLSPQSFYSIEDVRTVNFSSTQK